MHAVTEADGEGHCGDEGDALPSEGRKGGRGRELAVYYLGIIEINRGMNMIFQGSSTLWKRK
eukprot:scaffold14220_cov151-Skeletonema_dohrnii-CCMP3373.AAC.3